MEPRMSTAPKMSLNQLPMSRVGSSQAENLKKYQSMFPQTNVLQAAKTAATPLVSKKLELENKNKLHLLKQEGSMNLVYKKDNNYLVELLDRLLVKHFLILHHKNYLEVLVM